MSAVLDNPELLACFEPLSLAAFESAQPVRRSEQKYLLREAALQQLLPALRAEFRILEHGGTREFRYETDYADTADFTLYHDHLNDKPGRIKLRLRRYLDAGMAMLELKQKLGNGRIRKTRLRIAPGTGVTTADVSVLQSRMLPHDAREWHFCLRTRYNRVSLLASDARCRLTIDTRIEALAPDHRQVRFSDLAIIELKIGTLPGAGTAIRALIRAAGGIRTPFSKYMAGMAALHPELISGVHARRFQVLHQLSIIPRFL